MPAHPSNSPLRCLSWADRLTYVGLLLLLVGLAFQYGTRWRARSAEGAAVEDFYPPWAVTARYNRPLLALDTESALGRLDPQPKALTLKDLARVHGHLCDGLVISWMELGQALRQLFPQGVVDRTDLRVVSKNGPCWVDAAAWMTGARVNHGTLVLDNGVGDGFIVQRISTGEAVQVRLRLGVFPAELAALERSIRKRRAGGQRVESAEIDRFEALAADFSRRLLNTPPPEAIEVLRLREFAFPTASPDLIVPRSDIINRDLSPMDGTKEKDHD